jgi:hypothetical protein
MTVYEIKDIIFDDTQVKFWDECQEEIGTYYGMNDMEIPYDVDLAEIGLMWVDEEGILNIDLEIRLEEIDFD